MGQAGNFANRCYGRARRDKTKGCAVRIIIALLFVFFFCLGMFSGNLLAKYSAPPVDAGRPDMPRLADAAIAADFKDYPANDTQKESIKAATTADSAWHLILVNRWNPIPEDYEVKLTELTNGQLVDARIYPALQDMLDAARGEGIYPMVVSGYRTAAAQQRLLNEKTAQYKAEGFSDAAAKAQAEAWVAIPGTSEHQIGIAVDINADGVRSAGFEVYAWLEQNAHKYGFICRYPPDKTEITGVIGEAWHYRYVGIEAATEMWDQGLCLEEYLMGAN